MTKKPKSAEEIVAANPEPGEREARSIAHAKAEDDKRPARPQLMAGKSSPGVIDVYPPHSDAKGMACQLNDLFGTTAEDFVSRSLLALANQNVDKQGVTNVPGLNGSLALVAAIDPRNELEASLALQMVATHDLTMAMLTRTRNAEYVDSMREYGNLATKLSRTFTMQMKALAEWRRGGEQVVRHIHVYEGGQAVVAETVNVGGQNANLADQCHAPFATLPRADPVRHAMPRASGEGEEAVSDARGQKSGSGVG